MRVIINGLQAGNRSGTGVHTIELVRLLLRVAGDVELRVVWPKDVPPPPLVSPESQTILLKSGHGALSRIAYDQLVFPREARRLGGDVVHYPANVGALAGAGNMVVTVHDLSFLHNAEWFTRERALYYRATVGLSVGRAKRVIAVSQATADDVVSRLGVPEDRVDVVHNGVGERFEPASEESQMRVREELGLPERFLLYLGTLEPRKNLVRLIRAWSRVAGECCQDLVLAGREGWKVGPIREAAAQSPHGRRIRMLGHVADEWTPALYSAADAFVFPSLFEGFGMPVLEAMACGTPVLTSNLSGLREVAGAAALLVDPRDEESIADGMRRVASDEALRDTLAKQGRARASGFTWRRSAELTLNSYRSAAV